MQTASQPSEKPQASREQVIAALRPKYAWWSLEGSESRVMQRVLAQIMNFGTYDDIRAVEGVFDRSELIDVLVHAEPGWFTPRSWDFWRGRLSPSSDGVVPARPPRRSFDADSLRTRP